MNLFRTTAPIELAPIEVFTEIGDWQPKSALKSKGGLILTNVSSTEEEMLKEFQQSFDPTALRGVMLALHIKDRDEGDPEQINLMTLPHNGTVIRHMDRFYIVRLVVQGTNYSAAVFVDRMAASDFWKRTGAEVQHV